MRKSAYHLYRRLPLAIRDRLRWIRHPVNALVTAAIYRAARHTVVSGPFAGMVLSGDRPHLPYILGTQELEIHECIVKLVALRFDKIVNVGAADGYYAVGMGVRCQSAAIEAFEADVSLHQKLLAAATTNGVAARMKVLGRCSQSDLASAVSPGSLTLLIVDIEGGELDVLGAKSVEYLKDAFVLVETHDVLRPRCSETLSRLFSGTHAVEHYKTRTRTLGDMPVPIVRAMGRLLHAEVLGTMSEQRAGPQEFLLMIPSSFTARNRW